jgi:hypothetical protein
MPGDVFGNSSTLRHSALQNTRERRPFTVPSRTISCITSNNYKVRAEHGRQGEPKGGSGSRRRQASSPISRKPCGIPFSTVPSEALFPVFEERGKGLPPDLIYCGEDKAAKRTGARLIRDGGFNPVDLARCPWPATQNRSRCWLRNLPTTVPAARHSPIASSVSRNTQDNLFVSARSGRNRRDARCSLS